MFRRIPEDRAYPLALNNLGTIELDAGRLDDACRHYEESLSIRRSRLGPDHLDVATTLYSLGCLYTDLGDYERALEAHRRAVVIWRRALGDENPSYGVSLAAEAESLRRLGRPRQALERAQEGLAVLDGKVGADHRWTSFARVVVGASMVDLGRHRDAIPFLKRSLELLTPTDPDRAMAKFHLGRAMAATGNRAPAAELAGEARRQLGQIGRKRDVAVLDAWSARALRR